MAHKHSVYDTDTHFSINPITRAIKNESSTKTTVMQYDHNSERFTFELPRMIEGHDMSLCNEVEVHYLNGTNSGVYAVDDFKISPDGDDVVICSWLISCAATQLVAALNFLLRFSCVSDDGTVDYAWHSGVFSGISVSNGMNNGEAVVKEYPDVLAAWQARITSVETRMKKLEENGGNSVSAEVVQTDNGAIITIGETTATVTNGTNGADGAHWWIATISFGGSDVLNKTYIATVEGIEIAVGDLILYTDGIVCQVTAVASSNVIVKNTGINLKDSKVNTAKIGEITLLSDSWVGEASPYSQVVTLAEATENSQVDLTPSVEQLAIFHDKDITFVAENEGGVVTVYVIGQRPENDYTIQVTITEVAI